MRSATSSRCAWLTARSFRSAFAICRTRRSSDWPSDMVGGERIDPTDHLRRPWRVHALAAAERLEVHDVWEIAIQLPAGVPLARWVESLSQEPRPLAARALFAL